MRFSLCIAIFQMTEFDLNKSDRYCVLYCDFYILWRYHHHLIVQPLLMMVIILLKLSQQNSISFKDDLLFCLNALSSEAPLIYKIIFQLFSPWS